MALIRFNRMNLNLDVLVGIGETYKPTKKIKDVTKKVEDLRAKTNNTLMELFNTIDNQEILKLIAADKSKEVVWKNFIENEFKPQTSDLAEEIVKINMKLCANYTEYFAQNK